MNWTGFEVDLKDVLEKRPVEAVQNWQKYQEHDPKVALVPQEHIAADYGDVELCKHINTKQAWFHSKRYDQVCLKEYLLQPFTGGSTEV